MKKVLFIIALIVAFVGANAQSYDKLSGKWENGEKNLFFKGKHPQRRCHRAEEFVRSETASTQRAYPYHELYRDGL